MDHVDGWVEQMGGVPEESEWNDEGIWYRVNDDPPTYLPVGYSRNLPRTEKEGVWLVDERESPGKKLFVPSDGVDGYSAGVLMGEAKRATQWKTVETKWGVPPLLLSP